MAIVRAVKSGNWSDVTVWNTGALPTSADDVYSNTFTVTIDISPTVLSVSNIATTGVTAGGLFAPSNGITLTATGSGFNGGGGSNYAITSNLTTGQSCTIVGTANVFGVVNNSSGTVNLIGNSIGGTFNPGANNASTGTLNITGNATAGNSSPGVLNSSTGTLNITGTCTGGSGGSTTGAAQNAFTGTLNITGTCLGSPAGTNNFGALNVSTGTLNHFGAAQASSVCPAIGVGGISQNTFLSGPFIGTAQGVAANIAFRWRWVPSVGSSYMTVPNSTATGYKNLFTADNTSSASGQPAATNVRSGTVYGPNSELTGTCAVPAAGSVALGVPVDNTTGTAILTQQNITDALTTSLGTPAAISGISSALTTSLGSSAAISGISSALTTSLGTPAAISGISSALTSASAVTLNQPTSTFTSPGSIGERLKLASTVVTTAQQLSDVLSNE